MKIYAESTDGSFTEEKESALVWSYAQADPDFGRWQVSPTPSSLGSFQFLALCKKQLKKLFLYPIRSHESVSSFKGV